jgi:short-subunit dehydrogenase
MLPLSTKKVTTMPGKPGSLEKEGRTCLLIKGDLTRKTFRNKCTDKVKEAWGSIDILVNNAGITPQKTVSKKSLMNRFRKHLTNIFP